MALRQMKIAGSQNLAFDASLMGASSAVSASLSNLAGSVLTLLSVRYEARTVVASVLAAQLQF